MNQLLTRSYCAIDECLRQCTEQAQQVNGGRWQFALRNGTRVTATADAAFLLFDGPSPVVCYLEQAPQWLRWNAELAGNAKFALVPKPWRLRLRAEMLVDDEANTYARIAEIVRGMEQARQLLEKPHASPGEFRQSASGDASSRNLLALLRETGWPFQERAEGSATVELATRGGCCRVLLDENGDGLHVGVEFLRTHSLTSTSSLALAAMLLSASGTLRLGRPYAADAGGMFTCGFELRFAGETTAGELEHTLEALAVASWACTEEVHTLLDNTAATQYLAVRNLSPTFEREEF